MAEIVTTRVDERKSLRLHGMLSGVRSLSIALLGAPRIEVDGRPLVVDTRKATAALAFLAVTGHTHTRAVVAELLWPNADAERSRSALRRPLSTLRGALGEGRLISDRITVRLDLDGAFFDLTQFRSAAADPAAGIEALSAAVALHRDELLAGFALRDSVGFDDWQRGVQESVRRERGSALDRLVELLAHEGRFEEAIDPTVGVDFFARLIEVRPGVRVKLQLWDTAGQERFRQEPLPPLLLLAVLGNRQ